MKTLLNKTVRNEITEMQSCKSFKTVKRQPDKIATAIYLAAIFGFLAYMVYAFVTNSGY